MHTLTSISWHAAVVLRWTALVAGTLLFLFFLAFFFGEGPPNLVRLTTAERVQVIGITSLFSGLVVAWKWQGLGGLIAMSAFGLLVAIQPSHGTAWGLYIPAMVGLIHLLCWARLRGGPPGELVPWRLPRSLFILVGTALAVFVLLCANELFGQPPLMTPALAPGGELTGRWTGNGASPVEFLIESDGTVTGVIGETSISDGKIVYGRSWFGRMMQMNSPYRVMGKLAGRTFTAPLRPAGETLEGSLFLEKVPTRITLSRR
ncbi:MAG: hypothetical protein KIT83_02215 [Bryobacterales bacterium]|nr:hypothetical protein [Bryobacterales bacterium]